LKLEHKIALKYIFTSKDISFVKIINLLATIGTTIGVAAIIFTVSILSGFQVMNYEQILGYDPHIRVHLSSNKDTNNNILDYVGKSKSVGNYALTSEKKSVIRVGNNIKVARLLYIDPLTKSYLDGINHSLLFGKLQANSKSIVIGAKLAEGLDVTRGSYLELITPDALEKSARLFRQVSGKNYLVSGIFYSNVKDYDEKQVFIYDTSSPKEFLDIKLNNYEQTDEFITELKEKFGSIGISSWKELNSDFYKIMQFEKMMTIAVLFIIILISVFSILASLAMTVIQKKKDIAILQTLGMSKQRIISIFRSEGIFIGAIGTFLGSVIGLTLTYMQDKIGLLKFGKGITIQAAFPISYEYMVYIIVIITTLLLSWAATYLPTKRISKSSILDGLREE
jgi:lipoprotein-releasing system permease protein